MRNLILAALLLFALASCSEDTAMDEMQAEFAANQYPQKWELASMSGQVANKPPLTGAAMAWQEYYIFNDDATFTKTRQQSNTTTVAAGTYAFQNISGEQYLILTYNSSNGIIGSCIANNKEELKVGKNWLQNTWNACDGPGLVYKRVTFVENGN